MKTTILYEGAIFQILRCGGVARYFSELIAHLPHEFRPIVTGPRDDPPELSHPLLRYQGVATEPPAAWLRKWTRSQFQKRIAAEFNSTSADIEHWTYYEGLCRRRIERTDRPLVSTVLDFVHEQFPDLDPSGKHVQIKHDAIEAADHLICISQSTRDELCQRVPQARDKTTVIPLGTSLTEVNAEPVPPELLDKPYVLFVGRRNSYKNFAVVWRAWQRLADRLPPEARLVIVGPPMKRREAQELGWQDDESVALFPNASDAMLKGLYQQARSFIFPSKAEGFGLPSLEAMAAGTPVMVSDLPVMHEVVGGCGYYFDPDDIGMVAEMMWAAVNDTLPGRDAIVELGKKTRSTIPLVGNSTQDRDALSLHSGPGNTKSRRCGGCWFNVMTAFGVQQHQSHHSM